MSSLSDTDWIVSHARTLGFDLCGVASTDSLGDVAHRDEWLSRGYAGQMRYLHDPRRADPTRALADAKSVIVCALNYNAPVPQSTAAVADAAIGGRPRGWISRYAWGDDYHNVLDEKLEQLTAALTNRFGDAFTSRAYVDTGPIAERVAARHAGLGWLAKNTCLINQDIGSWLFLGVILTSLDLASSAGQGRPLPADLCGNCRLCIDACPTGAFVAPYVMDARRCISYLTIELRDSIPEEFRAAMGWQVFGCDICQDVCPWNRTAPATSIAAFAPRDKLFAPELVWLLSLDELEFRDIFRGSPIKRTKWRGLLRNACVAAGNAGVFSGKHNPQESARLRERLDRLAASDDAILSEHARWALARLTGAAK